MFLEQWKALSARIRGIVQAGQLHAQYFAVRQEDSFGRAAQIREELQHIIESLNKFRTSFSSALPPAAHDAIDDCVGKISPLLSDDSGTPNGRQEKVWAALVMLAAYETNIAFVLTDVQSAIRARSERAFAHLQRLIVVDAHTRERWKAAFHNGETDCERCGAVHLLFHGIWAFKVSATGERTDLVYQQPAGDLIDEQRYVEGFVLTEWKIATESDSADIKFQAARAQAKRYAQGLLAGCELSAFRYAVVVSLKHVQLPPDIQDEAVIYRHVNIAVDPEAPSRARTGTTRTKRT